MNLYKKIVFGLLLSMSFTDVSVARFEFVKYLESIDKQTTIDYCTGMIYGSLTAGSLLVGNYARNAFNGNLKASDSKLYFKAGAVLGGLGVLGALVRQYQRNRLHEAKKFRANFFATQNIEKRFTDIVEYDIAKDNLQTIIDVFENPSIYFEKRVTLPHGVLFHGSANSGKTLFAHALAGETGSSFIDLTRDGAVKAIKNNEKQALTVIVQEIQKHDKVIVFLGKINKEKLSFAQRLWEKALHVLKKNPKPVLFVGEARDVSDVEKDIDEIDDLHIHFVYVCDPVAKMRESMIKHCMNQKKLNSSADINNIAKMAHKFMYKDIKKLVDKAYFKAIHAGRDVISTRDFDQACFEMTHLYGKYDYNKIDRENLKTAYHEAGHSLVMLLHEDYIFNFYKVTIQQTLRYGGLTTPLRVNYYLDATKKGFLALIACSLAGLAAEEIFQGAAGCGPSIDLQHATDRAYDMIARYGMTDEFGKSVYDSKEIRSDEKAQKLVKKILDEQYKVAKNLLLKHKDKLEKLAHALMEKKTLYAEEVHELLGTVDRRHMANAAEAA